MVPTEVEAVLRTHPSVLDVVVLGLPDTRYGQVVGAMVVAASDPAPTLDELRTFAASRLAGFKLPRRTDMVEVIPRTPATGQPQRALIVERLLTGESQPPVSSE